MASTVYKKAPLVEMVAEVRWDLAPLAAVPNAALDPFHDSLKGALTTELAKGGFSLVEELVPAEVPREFLAGQVVTRYRKSASEWPIIQLGPGVFTVNVDASYSGWATFRPYLELAFNALVSSHPAPQAWKVNLVRLIAIDAYEGRHGYTNYSEFSRTALKLGPVLPPSFLERFSVDQTLNVVRSETLFPLRQLENSIGKIAIADGIHRNAPALLVTTTVDREKSFGAMSAQNLVSLFDQSHDAHRALFHELLGVDLRSALEPEEQE